MSSTVLRLGLYLLVVVLVLYILDTTYEHSIIADFVDTPLLSKAMGVGALLVIVGFVLGLMEKAASKIPKSRCTVCRTPVSKGAIYCREHLRGILSDEDEKTHMTRSRR